ncbi:MAG: hypothetical protein ACI8RZ_007589 [Myxococcota bacterium]|jgi:hypothetical protein
MSTAPLAILRDLIARCPEITQTLAACRAVGLPEHYVAGGVVTQVLWNHLEGRAPLEQVRDIDVVYFAPDEDAEAERARQAAMVARVEHSVPIDVVNQARVHTWYGDRYGHPIAPLTSTEAGIDGWLSAFAIGVRGTDPVAVYAPLGLDDAFAQRLRPNRQVMRQASYEAIAAGAVQRWPAVTVLPWR